MGKIVLVETGTYNPTVTRPHLTGLHGLERESALSLSRSQVVVPSVLARLETGKGRSLPEAACALTSALLQVGV